MRLSSQVKILTKYKNTHVWNDPLYQVKRLIHNQWKSIWLQQAWEQDLMSFLRYCLIKPILQVRKSLRGKILSDLFSNSFLYQFQKNVRFPSCQSLVICEVEHQGLQLLWAPLYILVHFTLYYTFPTTWTLSIIPIASYKMWIKNNQWVLSGVRWHMANITNFLALMQVRIVYFSLPFRCI